MTSSELTKFQILTKYFMDNFPMEVLFGKQKPENWQDERAKYYLEKILDLKAAIDRIKKYKLYFSQFYPPADVIPEAEAIEYHWHSYIQDFYILEERVKNLIGSMKNDLSLYQIEDPDLARKLLDHLKTNILRGLTEAHDLRRKHTHEKTARNFDLSRATALKLIKESAQNTDPKRFDDALIEEKIKEFTAKSKNDFIEISLRNEGAMTELEDFFAPRFGHLFASLNGHDYSIFKMN